MKNKKQNETERHVVGGQVVWLPRCLRQILADTPCLGWRSSAIGLSEADEILGHSEDGAAIAVNRKGWWLVPPDEPDYSLDGGLLPPYEGII